MYAITTDRFVELAGMEFEGAIRHQVHSYGPREINVLKSFPGRDGSGTLALREQGDREGPPNYPFEFEAVPHIKTVESIAEMVIRHWQFRSRFRARSGST